MRIPTCTAAATILVLLPLALSAQSSARSQPSGYLTGAALPDLIRILPSAPEPDSPRDIADRQIFKATRALQDSPRWKLAQSDDILSVTALIADFDCSTGVIANPDNAPLLARMLARVARDAGAVTGPAKERFHRRRPFLVDHGPVCIGISPSFEKSFDYPSGHTTLGWAVGLILAQIDPAHATGILTRARAFGESRVVCGVHNASAVESGRVAGAALVAALNANQSFRDDLDKVRTEFAALQPKAGQACTAETSLIAKSPY